MSHPDTDTPKIDPATGRPLADKVNGGDIRPAGPDGIPDLPEDIAEDWDETDQAGDESFPASDPPGQGVG
ncbi:hypothetical protein [Polymorphobacter sp.]|uniref:hypothetical protein n=1 Tax=Polymorphobacter sp. TaxID=1909290 RepID=UPI003F71E33C